MGITFEIIRAILSGTRSRRTFRLNGTSLELEIIDILKSDAATVERVRRELIEVMDVAYTRKTSPDGRIVGPEEYVDRALDRATFDCFNTVIVARDGERLVGFTASYVQRRRVLGREIEIVRFGAHVVPAAQSSGLLRICFIVSALRYARARLWVNVPRYYLGLCLNPMTYRFVCRRARRMYPSPTEPDDPLMVALCAAGFPSERWFQDTIVEPRAPQLSASLRASIEASQDPLVRYYCSRCPRFAEGYGLPFAAEIGLGNFVYTSFMHVWLALTKRRRPS